jgi:hypothetical protein
MRPAPISAIIAGVLRLTRPKSTKKRPSNPFMAAERSPTGKQLAGPVLARALPRASNPPQDSADELIEDTRAELKRVAIAVILWCALAAILYINTVVG